MVQESGATAVIMVLGFGDYLDVVREVEYCRCPHCGGWEMAVCSLPLYVVGSKDGREYCQCDDCGKTLWHDASEKAQCVRRVSPAMILGLELVPEGMVAYIVGLGSEYHVEFAEGEKLGAVDVESSSGGGSLWIKTESNEGGSSESGGSLEECQVLPLRQGSLRAEGAEDLKESKVCRQRADGRDAFTSPRAEWGRYCKTTGLLRWVIGLRHAQSLNREPPKPC